MKYEHLICEGFKHGYTWIFHGESSSSSAYHAHEGAQVEARDELPKMLRHIGSAVPVMALVRWGVWMGFKG